MTTTSDKNTDPKREVKQRTLKTRNQTLSFSKLLDFNNIKDKLKLLTTSKSKGIIAVREKQRKEYSMADELLCKYNNENNSKGICKKKASETGSLISEESMFSKKCSIVLI